MRTVLRPGLLLVMLSLAAVPAFRVRADADLDACLAAHEAAQLAHGGERLRDAATASLRCAQPSCPAPVRRDCLALHDELARTLPSVVFVVRSLDGRDVAARVEVGDALTLARPDGRAHALDPGVYALRVTAEGYAPHVEELVVHTAEQQRVLRVVLVPSEAEAAHRAPPRSLPSGAVLGIGGAAAVALVAAGGLLVRGHRQKACAPDCSDAEADSIRRNILLADVLGPLGGGLAITALTLHLWGRAPDAPRAAFQPSLNASSRGVVVMGHLQF
jgi:hypothetical protein